MVDGKSRGIARPMGLATGSPAIVDRMTATDESAMYGDGDGFEKKRLQLIVWLLLVSWTVV